MGEPQHLLDVGGDHEHPNALCRLLDEGGIPTEEVVLEVTDEKSLPKARRKQLQIEHAAQASRRAKLVKLANTFASDILLARAEARHKTVEAKSIFGVLLLAATKGTEIEIICEGTDEAAALEAICQLIESKFGEE